MNVVHISSNSEYFKFTMKNNQINPWRLIMMYSILYLIVVIIHFLFMMLTTLLPILIFKITNSITEVGIVLTVFMLSMILVRITCMVKKIKPIEAIIFGTFVFFIGFIIINIYHTQIHWYYVGSILFGISIGLTPPAVLTLLTVSPLTSKRNLSIYNSCVAFASALAPFLGEYIYNNFGYVIYYIWIIGGLCIFLLSIIIKRLENNEDIVQNGSLSKDITFLRDGQYISSFIILLIASLSYGVIVAYLPIFLNEIKFSIGFYYLVFWSSYIIAQFINEYIYKALSDKIIITLLLVGLAIGEFIISFATLKLMYFLSALIYGLSYGLIYNLFYLKASFINDEQSKNNAYAIIGLMSYIGVGLAPTLLAPFLNILNIEIRMIFALSTIYIMIGILIHLLSQSNKPIDQ